MRKLSEADLNLSDDSSNRRKLIQRSQKDKVIPSHVFPQNEIEIHCLYYTTSLPFLQLL